MGNEFYIQTSMNTRLTFTLAILLLAIGPSLSTSAFERFKGCVKTPYCAAKLAVNCAKSFARGEYLGGCLNELWHGHDVEVCDREYRRCSRGYRRLRRKLMKKRSESMRD